MRKLMMAVAAMVAALSLMANDDGIVFHSLDGFPLYGTAVPDASKKYSRLPDSLKDQVREELWSLGLNSAGLSLRFATDASTIKARWTSLNKFNMNHMTPTGIRGLDLYVMMPDSTWTTVGSARPSLSNKTSTSTIMRNMEPEMREYMLFLSLYDGVDSIYIGVDSTAVVRFPAVDLPRRDKPVVMYGTSILQGGCATRPGMAHTNILQRALNREVINLGFSGNGRLDPEIANIMASVDASVYVIDPLPNLTTPELTALIGPFVEIIRAAHPATPIVFVESPIFPLMRFDQEVDQTITEKNVALCRYFDALQAAGDNNIYYFRGEDVLGKSPELTVDNYHFTDVGFIHYADALLPLLQSLIAD